MLKPESRREIIEELLLASNRQYVQTKLTTLMDDCEHSWSTFSIHIDKEYIPYCMICHTKKSKIKE